MPYYINSINTKNNIGIYPIHESWIDRKKISNFEKAKLENLNFY